MKVAQIIPYFGKWPEWIDLYFYSCHKNPMVDFIIYTDCPIHSLWKDYKNVKFIPISFAHYCQLVSARLGIDYSISNAYKLTDLKPFLGKVHEEELKGYDFWGFGDLDLVYGDLSMLVNDDILKRYELITTHNYHIAGHFTLCKNNEYYRTLCLKIKDWETRLISDTHYGFDEAEWSNLIYPQLGRVRRLYDFLKPFGIKFNLYMEWANRLVSPHKLFSEFFTTPAPKAGQIWIYSLEGGGTIISPIGKELPYLHFLFFKKTPWLQTDTYWREGYYTLNHPIEQYKEIAFDVDSIKGIL